MNIQITRNADGRRFDVWERRADGVRLIQTVEETQLEPVQPSAAPALDVERKCERPIPLLRETLSTLCHFMWYRQTRPGEHLWSIPPDKERDFDCIFSDVIDEVEFLRAEVARLRALQTPEK